MTYNVLSLTLNPTQSLTAAYLLEYHSVIFVNENENENGEKRENYDFVNEN